MIRSTQPLLPPVHCPQCGLTNWRYYMIMDIWHCESCGHEITGEEVQRDAQKS
jgi:ribosomal protein L37AE/L43A